MISFFFLLTFIIVYIYAGYDLLLKVMKLFTKEDVGEQRIDATPSLTVLLTVYNEEELIQRRITNLLECKYPPEKLQVVVASDGSTDTTEVKVREMEGDIVKLFVSDGSLGKTGTQNKAIDEIQSEVILFTDAGTSFDKNTLLEMMLPFGNEAVGGVTGHVLFREKDEVLSKNQGYYWAQELSIRQSESQLGILAVASGACMAIRRELFRPMSENVGEDCLLPLDVVDQGARMVHASRALAYDEMENSSSGEYKTRVRMTLRNWQGTWLYPQLLNPFLNPWTSFSLWSHKILRWLSPMFMLAWLATSITLLIRGYILLAVPACLLLLLLGCSKLGLNFPGANTVASFYLANKGFLVGVAKALSNEKVHRY